MLENCEFTYNEPGEDDVASFAKLLYTDHPSCNIQIERGGRIVFSPKAGHEKVGDLEGMPMPSKKFWEAVSTLIHSLSVEATTLRGKLAISKAVQIQMSKDLDDSHKRPIIIGKNDKRAFFAGIAVGKLKER